jgi:hypothetical protein
MAAFPRVSFKQYHPQMENHPVSVRQRACPEASLSSAIRLCCHLQAPYAVMQRLDWPTDFACEGEGNVGGGNQPTEWLVLLAANFPRPYTFDTSFIIFLYGQQS